MVTFEYLILLSFVMKVKMFYLYFEAYFFIQ